jgi:hypothetical protein
VPEHAALEEIDLNYAPGLVLVASAGRPVVAIMIETDGDRICAVFAISNPDKLAAISATTRAA